MIKFIIKFLLNIDKKLVKIKMFLFLNLEFYGEKYNVVLLCDCNLWVYFYKV